MSIAVHPQMLDMLSMGEFLLTFRELLKSIETDGVDDTQARSPARNASWAISPNSQRLPSQETSLGYLGISLSAYQDRLHPAASPEHQFRRRLPAGFDRKGEGRGVFRWANANGGVEGKWRASAVGDRDVIVGPVGWLSASSWLLQRNGWSQAGWGIFGRTKSECSQQRKSHNQREEEEVLLSHLLHRLGIIRCASFPFTQ
jgi:hypothetical protein